MVSSRAAAMPRRPTPLLQNLGMTMPDNYTVDGINIMPALKGGKLERNGIKKCALALDQRQLRTAWPGLISPPLGFSSFVFVRSSIRTSVAASSLKIFRLR
jgi:hypothetical protein